MPVLRSLVSRAVLLGAVSTLWSCATRDVPARYPASSAASEQAATPPLPSVTTSLEDEPPLVDEAYGGPRTPDHGAHHHGH